MEERKEKSFNIFLEAPFVFFAHLDKEAEVAGTEHRRNMLVVIYDQDFWGRNREEEEKEKECFFLFPIVTIISK